MSRSPEREGDAAAGAAAGDSAGSYPTSAFEYELPPELIARHPAQRRDESRLMVVDRARGTITDHVFRDLPSFISAGDAVVLNETRVFPARLIGTRSGGGAAEVLLLRPAEGEGEGESGSGGEWETRASAGSGPAEAAGESAGRAAHAAPADAEPGAAAKPADIGAREAPRRPHSPTSPLLHSGGTAAEGPALWEALVRPGSKLRPGKVIEIGADLHVRIVAARPDGTRVVELQTPLPTDRALERYGRVPLPPYIDRAAEPEDTERYQTVYARERGSVAAPTAGLHFTQAVLRALEARGAELVRLVLHVGPGTFRPVAVEDPATHRMHSEWYRVPAEAAASLNAVRERGGRIWAVGTTVTRTLETVTEERGRVNAGEGWTDIFIRPPYRFRAVDGLVTNFHLPRSTLLMLVAAFAGRDLILRAYREAVERHYRFYSYGDAMLIL